MPRKNRRKQSEVRKEAENAQRRARNEAENAQRSARNETENAQRRDRESHNEGNRNAGDSASRIGLHIFPTWVAENAQQRARQNTENAQRGAHESGNEGDRNAGESTSRIGPNVLPTWEAENGQRRTRESHNEDDRNADDLASRIGPNVLPTWEAENSQRRTRESCNEGGRNAADSSSKTEPHALRTWDDLVAERQNRSTPRLQSEARKDEEKNDNRLWADIVEEELYQDADGETTHRLWADMVDEEMNLQIDTPHDEQEPINPVVETADKESIDVVMKKDQIIEETTFEESSRSLKDEETADKKTNHIDKKSIYSEKDEESIDSIMKKETVDNEQIDGIMEEDPIGPVIEQETAEAEPTDSIKQEGIVEEAVNEELVIVESHLIQLDDAKPIIRADVTEIELDDDLSTTTKPRKQPVLANIIQEEKSLLPSPLLPVVAQGPPKPTTETKVEKIHQPMGRPQQRNANNAKNQHSSTPVSCVEQNKEPREQSQSIEAVHPVRTLWADEVEEEHSITQVNIPDIPAIQEHVSRSTKDRKTHWKELPSISPRSLFKKVEEFPQMVSSKRRGVKSCQSEESESELPDNMIYVQDLEHNWRAKVSYNKRRSSQKEDSPNKIPQVRPEKPKVAQWSNAVMGPAEKMLVDDDEFPVLGAIKSTRKRHTTQATEADQQHTDTLQPMLSVENPTISTVLPNNDDLATIYETNANLMAEQQTEGGFRTVTTKKRSRVQWSRRNEGPNYHKFGGSPQQPQEPPKSFFYSNRNVQDSRDDRHVKQDRRGPYSGRKSNRSQQQCQQIRPDERLGYPDYRQTHQPDPVIPSRTFRRGIRSYTTIQWQNRNESPRRRPLVNENEFPALGLPDSTPKSRVPEYVPLTPRKQSQRGTEGKRQYRSGQRKQEQKTSRQKTPERKTPKPNTSEQSKTKQNSPERKTSKQVTPSPPLQIQKRPPENVTRQYAKRYDYECNLSIHTENTQQIPGTQIQATTVDSEMQTIETQVDNAFLTECSRTNNQNYDDIGTNTEEVASSRAQIEEVIYAEGSGKSTSSLETVPKRVLEVVNLKLKFNDGTVVEDEFLPEPVAPGPRSDGSVNPAAQLQYLHEKREYFQARCRKLIKRHYPNVDIASKDPKETYEGMYNRLMEEETRHLLSRMRIEATGSSTPTTVETAEQRTPSSESEQRSREKGREIPTQEPAAATDGKDIAQVVYPEEYWTNDEEANRILDEQELQEVKWSKAKARKRSKSNKTKSTENNNKQTPRKRSVSRNLEVQYPKTIAVESAQSNEQKISTDIIDDIIVLIPAPSFDDLDMEIDVERSEEEIDNEVFLESTSSSRSKSRKRWKSKGKKKRLDDLDKVLEGLQSGEVTDDEEPSRSSDKSRKRFKSKGKNKQEVSVPVAAKVESEEEVLIAPIPPEPAVDGFIDPEVRQKYHRDRYEFFEATCRRLIKKHYPDVDINSRRIHESYEGMYKRLLNDESKALAKQNTKSQKYFQKQKDSADRKMDRLLKDKPSSTTKKSTVKAVAVPVSIPKPAVKPIPPGAEAVSGSEPVIKAVPIAKAALIKKPTLCTGMLQNNESSSSDPTEKLPKSEEFGSADDEADSNGSNKPKNKIQKRHKKRKDITEDTENDSEPEAPVRFYTSLLQTEMKTTVDENDGYIRQLDSPTQLLVSQQLQIEEHAQPITMPNLDLSETREKRIKGIELRKGNSAPSFASSLSSEENLKPKSQIKEIKHVKFAEEVEEDIRATNPNLVIDPAEINQDHLQDGAAAFPPQIQEKGGKRKRKRKSPKERALSAGDEITVSAVSVTKVTPTKSCPDLPATGDPSEVGFTKSQRKRARAKKKALEAKQATCDMARNAKEDEDVILEEPIRPVPGADGLIDPLVQAKYDNDKKEYFQAKCKRLIRRDYPTVDINSKPANQTYEEMYNSLLQRERLEADRFFESELRKLDDLKRKFNKMRSKKK